MSAISSATHNKFCEYKTETDVNYCQQKYSDRTFRLYFTCICTPNLELFDQGSCFRMVTRPGEGRVELLPVQAQSFFCCQRLSNRLGLHAEVKGKVATVHAMMA